MGISPPAGMRVRDDAIGEPARLAAALRPLLAAHPVPQSDPRTRGLLVETGAGETDLARLALRSPALAALFAHFVDDVGAAYLLAVNETPPGPPDEFLMRPHLDRRWRDGAFAPVLPRRTTVVFLDFPQGGCGGELVVFAADAFAGHGEIPRAHARRTVAACGGTLVPPQPGRACSMAGDLPHAVLSYTAPEAAAWRLVAVVGAFDPG